MTRLLAVVTLGAGLAACGPASLNPAVTGKWWGFSTVDMSDGSSVDAISTISVEVSGARALVSGVCPEGDGVLMLDGDANRASWTGELACVPHVLNDGGRIALAYLNLALRYEDETLAIDGGGACPEHGGAFTMSFIGLRL